MAGRFTVEAVFKAVDKMSAPVKRMSSGMGKFTRGAERGLKRVDKQLGKLTAGAKKFGAGLVAGAAIVGAAFANITNAGADFGRAVGSAAAKFGPEVTRMSDTFKELKATAREVGATTQFTATQAAEGLNFLAKAGFSAQFSMASLAKIVDFATASEMEFAEAADIASDALGAFGLDSDDEAKKMKGLERVMDVMALTANKTNVSVTELFESVKKAGPIAATAGVDVETFSATMGVLASNGIKASEAGTAAKNITLALAGVGNKAATTFGKLGIKLADANGNMRDQFDVMDDLRGKLKTMGTLEKVNVLNAIFGKLSVSAASKLLDGTGKKVRALRKDLQAAGGSSKRMADFIRDDVRGSLDGLNSAIEGVKIAIFDMNEGPLKDAIDKMTLWVRTNEALIASGIGNFFLMIIDNMEEIIATAKKVGIALGIFVALTAILKAFILVMTAVNLVMALNPVGLIVLGVLALIAAITLLVGWLDEVITKFDLIGKAKDLLPDFLTGGSKEINVAVNPPVPSAGDATSELLPDFVNGLLTDIMNGAPQGSEAAAPQVISKEERIARQVDEKRTTNTAELTVRTDKGTSAEVTGNTGPGVGIALEQTGAF
jgi:TP901 family phage tail tape measure protein